MIKDLKTDFWVSALIKRCEIGGASAFISHKGDHENGSVLIKIVPKMRFARLLIPSRNLDGELIFIDMTQKIAPNTEENELDIDEYIKKRLKSDNDLWIVEIEDKHGRDFLIERVE